MTTTLFDSVSERETANAQADVLRRATLQGVQPFTSLEDFVGEPEMIADFDVDEFLRQVRDDRERNSNRSLD
jgi:hypothetical protein